MASTVKRGYVPTVDAKKIGARPYLSRAAQAESAKNVFASEDAHASYVKEDTAQNNGGPLGGVGYWFEKVGLGFLSGLEGIWDYTAGGIADFVGADEWAEEQFDNDWVNYNHADEWYNPSDGWKFAGDIAGGIGTSLPAIAGAAIGAAITYYSGGSVAPLGVKIIAASLAPLAAGFAGAGNATKEAYRETGELGAAEYGYGAMVGATEAALEKVTAGLGTGGGRVIKAIGKKAARETGEAVVKSSARYGFKSLIADFGSEAFEEAAAEVLSPFYARATYDPDAKNATGGEVAYAALVGGLSGVVMGGTTAAAQTGFDFYAGHSSVQNGTAEQQMKAAERLIQYEQENKTGYEIYAEIADAYGKLQATLPGTGGKVTTVEQKNLLGKIKRNIAVAPIMPFIERSAINAVVSAEAIAERYNTFGMTDATTGKPIEVSAEAIRQGVDMSLMQSNPKEFRKQLNKAIFTNPVLSTVAIADTAGQLTADIQKMQTAATGSTVDFTQQDFDALLRDSTDQRKQEIGGMLGIENMDAVRVEEFNRRKREFVENGGVAGYREQVRAARVMRKVKKESAAALPESLPANLSDGAHRFVSADGTVDLGIYKNGDTYFLYDHKTRNVSKALSAGQVEDILKGQAAELAERANRSAENAKSEKQTDGKAGKTEDNKKAVTRTKKENVQVTEKTPDLNVIADSYSNEEKESILRDKKNRIAASYNDVLDFLSSVMNGTEKGRLFIGKIKSSIASKVKKETGISIQGKSVVLTGDETKHLFKHHGNSKTEALRGQEGVTRENFIRILDAIFDPDGVESLVDASGATTLVFNKDVEGRVTAVTIVSEKKKALTIKSAWITKKGQHISPPSDVQAPNQTPKSELSMNAVPDDSISHSAKKSNPSVKKYSYKDILMLARDQIADYKTLDAPGQSAVRMTLRQALAHGMSEQDALMYARVSAHTGIRVVFDKMAVGRDKDTQELIYADGFYNPRANEIVVNPEGKRSAEALLVHELTHAIYRTVDGRLILEREVRNLSDAEKQKITKRYAKVGQRSSLVLIDEMNAHYAEGLLANKNTLARLLDKKPTLSDRVLSFFRSAKQDYAQDKRLSRSGEKLLRHYKTLFDNFSAQNRANLGLEAVRVEDGGEDTRFAIKYPTFSEADISSKMDAIADMEAVATIDASKLERTGKKPSAIFEEYFASLGNSIYSELFGDIALGKSSVKSEIRHGITATKVASIEAIPSVIDKGKVIFHGKKDGGVERIVVCAPIKISNENYYMGVMLQRDAQTQYLYLHNVAIEKEMVNSPQTHLVTTGVNEENKHLSMTIILQNAINVKVEKQKTAKKPAGISSNSDIRFALPSASDKIVMSRGQVQKQKANYSSDRVFSKKEVTDALGGIPFLEYVPPDVREEWNSELWLGLNAHLDAGKRESFMELMSKRIAHEFEVSAISEESFQKIQKLKEKRNDLNARLKEIANEDKEITEQNEEEKRQIRKQIAVIKKKITKLYDDPHHLMDEWPQDDINRHSDNVLLSLNKLLEQGKPSVKAKLEEKFDASDAGKWKARYDEGAERNKLLGKIAFSALRMRDLKLGKFANSTQAGSDVFKKCIQDLSKIQFRGNVINAKAVRGYIADLSKWYTLKETKAMLGYGNGEMDSPDLWLQDIADKLEALVSGEGELSINDLKILNDVMSHFVHLVENQGKIYRNGKWVDAQPEIKRYIEIIELNKNIKLGPLDIFLRTKAGRWYSELFGDPMTVARLADKYAEGGFATETMDMLRDAAVNSDVEIMELLADRDAFVKKHGKYVENIQRQTVEYKGEQIPRSYLISLYMTAKRKQAWAGLVLNGFTFTDIHGNRRDVSGLIPWDSDITEDGLKQYAKNMEETFLALLTDTDREYISILEKVFEATRRLKAECDMQRLGYTNVSSGYYFPTRAADTATKLATPYSDIDRVSHASFNKSTVKGSKHRLLIEPVDVVFHRHVDGVCKYVHIAPVIDTIKTLLNTDISGNLNAPTNIKNTLEKTHTWSITYLTKLIADIQGVPASSSEGAKLLGKVRGSYAKFQLGANPKVWFTQLSSIFASSSILDVDSLIQGCFTVGAKGLDEYCSLAKLRNYDNTAAAAQGVLDTRMKRAARGVEKFSDALMVQTGMMDRFTVSRLFGACQAQVEKDGGAKVGTEENKVAAGKLLRRVILETQQNSLATERSAAMRSGSETLRAVTMFSADSMKVIGRVIDGVGEVAALRSRLKAATDPEVKADLKKRLKEAGKRRNKAVMAMALSAAFMVGVAELFRWLYNKDKDEDEKDWQRLVTDFIGNLLGGLPLVRDLHTLINDGFEMENPTYSVLNDLMSSVVGVTNATVDIFRKDGEVWTADKNRAIRNLAYAVGQVTGIPFRNVYNVLYGLTKRISPNTAYAIDTFFYEKNYQNDIYKAVEDGDDSRVSYIMGLLLSERMDSGKDKAVTAELVRLSNSGEKVLPRSIPDEYTLDGEKIPLTDEEQSAAKTVMSEAESALARLFTRREYKNLSDEEKAYAVNSVYDVYYDRAMVKITGKGEKNALLSKILPVDAVAVLSGMTRGMESDKDKDGKTLAGSKRKKVVAAIRALNVSLQERLLLICARGYTIQDGDIPGYTAARAKRLLLSYILSARGLSKAEKKKIAKMCGFEVKNGKIVSASLH